MPILSFLPYKIYRMTMADVHEFCMGLQPRLPHSGGRDSVVK